MRKKVFPLMLLLLIAASTRAEISKVGTSGAQFLKVGMGSKYQGMGEAAVAVVNDVYAVYWNPAGLAEIEGANVSFTNVNYLLDINLNFVGYAKNFGDVGTFGISATVLSTGDQEITTFEEQEGTGEYYSATSYTVGISYARQLNSRFSFGGTVKYVGERIYNERAEGVAFDFGTLLYTGVRSLRLGISITNMGPELRFTGPDLFVNYDDQNGDGANDPVSAELKTTPYDLPLAFRIGLAYDVDLAPNTVATFAGELKHPNDNVQQGALGAEVGFNELVFIRAGYKINYDEEGLSLGGGLLTGISKTTRLSVDYAWQEFGRLESTQRFSIGFLF